MRRSDIPFGSEFSPDQIDLRVLLELADTHGGDWRAFERAVYDRYFAERTCSESNRAKLANNTKLAMQAYGIIDHDAELTRFGRALWTRREDPDQIVAQLARHILVNLEGLTVLECIRSLQMAGEQPGLELIAQRLGDYDLYVPSTGRHLPTLCLWLTAAGVFSGGRYKIDENRVQQLVGMQMDDIEALSVLTPEQRAFLRALANLGPDDAPYPSNEVERLATATYGVTFSRKQISNQVIHPLENAGFIAAERGSGGRGAKPFLVTPTPKLVRGTVEPLLQRADSRAATQLRPFFSQPIRAIAASLRSGKRDVRRSALQALVRRTMRAVGLAHVASRPHAGGSELSLLFQSSRLTFSRWQVQCRDAAVTSTEDLARALGLAQFYKSNVVVMFTTGRIAEEARHYAESVVAGTNLSIVLIDGNGVRNIAENPFAVIDLLDREAGLAAKLKVVDA